MSRFPLSFEMITLPYLINRMFCLHTHILVVWVLKIISTMNIITCSHNFIVIIEVHI